MEAKSCRVRARPSKLSRRAGRPPPGSRRCAGRSGSSRSCRRFRRARRRTRSLSRARATFVCSRRAACRRSCRTTSTSTACRPEGRWDGGAGGRAAHGRRAVLRVREVVKAPPSAQARVHTALICARAQAGTRASPQPGVSGISKLCASFAMLSDFDSGKPSFTDKIKALRPALPDRAPTSFPRTHSPSAPSLNLLPHQHARCHNPRAGSYGGGGREKRGQAGQRGGRGA